jgi:hypothetical protein
MGYIMMVRTQITLPAELHRSARKRAAEQGLSLAGLVRRALERELDRPRPKGDVSAIIGLGDSGGSNVARYKHEYVSEAVEALHPRRR